MRHSRMFLSGIHEAEKQFIYKYHFRIALENKKAVTRTAHFSISQHIKTTQYSVHAAYFSTHGNRPSSGYPHPITAEQGNGSSTTASPVSRFEKEGLPFALYPAGNSVYGDLNDGYDGSRYCR